jgi:Domain of unknown function (DUF4389)
MLCGRSWEPGVATLFAAGAYKSARTVGSWLAGGLEMAAIGLAAAAIGWSWGSPSAARSRLSERFWSPSEWTQVPARTQGSCLAPATRMTRPLTLSVARPPQMARIHVFIRLALLVALGIVGCSSLYWLFYLGAPAVVALLVAQGDGTRYLSKEAPSVTRALRWLAGAYAYLWLLTDTPPSAKLDGTTHFELTPDCAPTAGSALLRIIYSLPALLLLAILSMVASVLWLVGAILILVRGQVPEGIRIFIEVTLRYQFWLVAYHLSLTTVYPSLARESASPASPSVA